MTVTARLTTAAVEAAVLAHQTARVTEAGVEVAVGTSTDYLSKYHADSASSTETASVQPLLAGSETGTAVESQAIKLFITASDAGTGDDSIAFPVQAVVGSDTGTAVSAETVFAHVAGVEVGFMSDGPSIQGTPSAADAGTAAEATAILATLLSVADTGAGGEAESVADFVTLSSADSASGVEGNALALTGSEIGTSVEIASSTAGVSAADSAQQGDVLAVAFAAPSDNATGSEAGSRIIIFDAAADLAQSHAIDLNAYLLLVLDGTVSLDRTVDIPGTGELIAIVDIQTLLGRTVTATPLADAVTVAEAHTAIVVTRTAAVTTDGTDILPPEPVTMQMSFVDSDLVVVAGGQVLVNVSLGEPDDTVSFYWGTATDPIQTAQLDDSGNLVSASVLVPIEETTGTHTLKVVGDLFGLATLDVPISSDIPAAVTETSTTDLPPAPPSSQRWQLFDPYAQETYLLPIGPSQIDAPYLTRNLTTAGTTSPLGQQIVWEGGRRASEWTCSGRLVDGDQIDTLRTWISRPHRVWLYDPLGRAWLIKITGIDLVPVRDLTHDKTHDWTLHALIYGRKT